MGGRPHGAAGAAGAVGAVIGRDARRQSEGQRKRRYAAHRYVYYVYSLT